MILPITPSGVSENKENRLSFLPDQFPHCARYGHNRQSDLQIGFRESPLNGVGTPRGFGSGLD
jgi:hypothetical protein